MKIVCALRVEFDCDKFLFAGYSVRDHEKVNWDISQVSLTVWDMPAEMSNQARTWFHFSFEVEWLLDTTLMAVHRESSWDTHHDRNADK